MIERSPKSIHLWDEISLHLPEDINPHHKRFIRQYYRGQARIAMCQEKKGKDILRGLGKWTGYSKFEDNEENQAILAAIDLATKGNTRWGVEPAFRLNNRT